jgi:UDP-2,3-diacylglucosamine pyrophosphatase LpxH
VHTLKNAQLDGVICGHIHHAEMKTIAGFLYINTGDFVESCTAVVEHHNGALELIHWHPEGLPDVSAKSDNTLAMPNETSLLQ